jgi:hypothetical protein
VVAPATERECPALEERLRAGGITVSRRFLLSDDDGSRLEFAGTFEMPPGSSREALAELVASRFEGKSVKVHWGKRTS